MIESKGHIKYLIYALLLFIPTVAHSRAEMFLIAIAVVVAFERKAIIEQFKEFRLKPFAKKYLFSFWLILIILLTSIINKIVNGNEILCLRDYYSGFYLFPLLILVSKYFGKLDVFKYLIAFTVIEVVVGCVEYAVGTRSFLLDLGDLNVITDRSLLYGSRVYGLSASSSIFAYKIMVGVILLEFSNFKKALSWILRIMLLIGVLLSFSRAVVVVLILFWIVRALYGVVKGRKQRQVFRSVPFQFNVLMVLLVIAFNSGIRYQLSRGGHEAESVFGAKTNIEKGAPETCAEMHAIEYEQGETDSELQGWGEKLMMRTEGIQTSGRKLIWLNYLNFIEKDLLFGMGGDKVMLRSWQNDTGHYKLIHAHNSFLMLLATNGLIIFGMYCLFYLLNFKAKNYLALTLVLIYSMLNYGIFWGFSYLDVIFIILLTLNFKDVYDYEGEN